MQKSRKFVLQKCLNERDSSVNGDMLGRGTLPETNPDNLGYQKSSDLSIIGESSVLGNQESNFNKSTFDDVEMQKALDEFGLRQRRYGKTGDQVEASA